MVNQTVLQVLFFQIARSVKTLLRLMAGWQYNAELTAFCASHFQCVRERCRKGFLLFVFAPILVYRNFCFIRGGNAACCTDIMHYWQYFIARFQARNLFRHCISITCQAAMHVKCISISTYRLDMFQRLQQLLSLMKLKMLNYWTIKMLNELMNPTNGQLYYSLTCSLYSNVGGRERKVKRSTVVTK